MKSCIRIVAIGCVVWLAAGCASIEGEPADASEPNNQKVVTLAQHPSLEQSPLDAPAPQTLIFQVDIYQLTFPFGTYGNNEEFWKRIDEQCVDVTTYDLLYKNGMRIGVADIRELRHFEKFMAKVVPAQRFTVRASEVRNIEVETKKDLPEQVIFQFDGNNRTPGRSYDRCDNIINISFEPAPRRPGELRLTLCPTVRAKRKHLEYSVRNEEREFEFVSDERMYDLNLRADVPLHGFMVVAPSEHASWPFSVGHAFLTRDMPAQRMEQVLLIIPRAYRVPEDHAKVTTGR